jgi:hypothetical protein
MLSQPDYIYNANGAPGERSPMFSPTSSNRRLRSDVYSFAQRALVGSSGSRGPFEQLCAATVVAFARWPEFSPDDRERAALLMSDELLSIEKPRPIAKARPRPTDKGYRMLTTGNWSFRVRNAAAAARRARASLRLVDTQPGDLPPQVDAVVTEALLAMERAVEALDAVAQEVPLEKTENARAS